ncbi:hypothetical protein, partial [Escherichia coli]|uniref:hypothetical protein n=1 Tax=Escherichia coli TaxID=562 RepID=UPI001BDB7DCA
MEYADGGLYQQSALSGALNNRVFPSRSDLSCHHFMLAWAIGGVVSVLLIKQLKRLLLCTILPLFGQERPHSPRILVS